MTQEQQKQVEVIAVYDGYVKKRFNSNIELFVGWENRIATPNGSPNLFDVDTAEYHKSDDWIMPVARKVWLQLFRLVNKIEIEGCNLAFTDEIGEAVLLRRQKKAEHHLQQIKDSAVVSTESTCTACYNAIVFLNTIK